MNNANDCVGILDSALSADSLRLRRHYSAQGKRLSNAVLVQMKFYFKWKGIRLQGSLIQPSHQIFVMLRYLRFWNVIPANVYQPSLLSHH